MIWRKQVAAGGSSSGGSGEGSGTGPTIGEDIDFNGSVRGVSVQSTHTGDIYNLGVRDIREAFVGLPYQGFQRSGGRDYFVDGELFKTYVNRSNMSPPFHGFFDAQAGGKYGFQNNFPTLDVDEALARFKYNWGDATFGGSNLYQMIIADLKKKWPDQSVLYNGATITINYNLYAPGIEEFFRQSQIILTIGIHWISRDDPDFDTYVTKGPLIDTYKVTVLDNLAFIYNFTAELKFITVDGWVASASAVRNFNTLEEANQGYLPGKSGFAPWGEPSIELTILPDGRLSLSSNTKNIDPSIYDIVGISSAYISNNAYPYLVYDPGARMATIDQLAPFDIDDGSGGKKTRYWRFPGYSTGGFNHGNIL